MPKWVSAKIQPAKGHFTDVKIAQGHKMQKTRQFCQNVARLAVIIFPLSALANQAAA
jgi:hypothetical protein